MDKGVKIALLLSRYWGGLMPESCRQAHVGEEWNCFFGYKVYPTLKSEYKQPPSFPKRPTHTV